MKKYLKIVIPFILIGLIAFVGYKVVAKINHKKQIAENIQTIPVFNYKKIDGTAFTNQNLKQNSKTIFIYFNSECEFCNEEAKMIQENIDKFNNVQLFFVSFEKPNLLSAFATKYKLSSYDNVTFICDSKTTFSTTFDIHSMPCLVLYDKNQKLIEKLKGQTKVETLLKKLNEI
ncbi:redoxin domain-containing protein [Flavobacterium sp.]|uniref:peroxiredoxin family protein n=1 Tax=Flavobacterium sp. TaxID=239 RepID=UPI00286DB684|nr:redoxin domain-containing protein [Flavobacterium sp.]